MSATSSTIIKILAQYSHKYSSINSTCIHVHIHSLLIVNDKQRPLHEEALTSKHQCTYGNTQTVNNYNS